MFNHNNFYEWAKRKNNIYISEYNMPDDFKQIASKEKLCNFGDNNGLKRLEKIFVPKK